MNFAKATALLIIVGLCSYALLLYSKPTEVSTVPKSKKSTVTTPLPNAQTKLFFSPNFLKLSAQSPYEVAIMINTGENTISQAQVEIQYDPKVVTVIAVRPGEFVRNTLPLVNKNDARRGRIEFAVGLPEGEQPLNGTGPLAVITIIPGPEATLSARTHFTFLPKSSVRSEHQNSSLLSKTESMLIEPNLTIPSTQTAQ